MPVRLARRPRAPEARDASAGSVTVPARWPEQRQRIHSSGTVDQRARCQAVYICVAQFLPGYIGEFISAALQDSHVAGKHISFPKYNKQSFYSHASTMCRQPREQTTVICKMNSKIFAMQNKQGAITSLRWKC